MNALRRHRPAGLQESGRVAANDRPHGTGMEVPMQSTYYQRFLTTRDRFWSHVETSGEGCWPWTGQISKRSSKGKGSAGYGVFRVGSRSDGTRRSVKAHRWLYETVVGHVPEGLELDHVCGNRSCVRLSHLEPVVHSVNIRRGHNPNRAKKYCPRGHPYDGVNTVVYNGARQCRMCRWLRNNKVI